MNLKDYAQPSVTADVIVFTIQDNQLKALLIKRNNEPFKGMWAIPGGFVREDESIDQAALRELHEETGVKDVYLEQLYTFGDVKRDPRGRVITISYFALINSEKIKLQAATDASEAKFFSISDLPQLAFDHKKILMYAVQRLRWKFEYTTVAFSLLPEKFTLSELQNIYEIVFSKKFDKRNFRKKIHSLNVIKALGVEKNVAHRPPKVYALKKKIGEIVEII